MLYLGDALAILPTIEADALVTDPPYGISYSSGRTGHDGGKALAGIAGDEDTSLRDAVLKWWGTKPALVFGSWKMPRPAKCRMVLTWEKGNHVGMGDLATPWKPNTEEVYVLGKGFSGHRGSSVLRYSAPVSWNSTKTGRVHPHQKPVDLMIDLIAKCPQGTIVDPFAGSGATGEACIATGRKFIGIEIDPTHFATAKRRISAALASRSELLIA